MRRAERGASRPEARCSAPGALTSVPRLGRAPPRGPHAAIGILPDPREPSHAPQRSAPPHRAGAALLGEEGRRGDDGGSGVWGETLFNSEKRL